jgi:integrase
VDPEGALHAFQGQLAVAGIPKMRLHDLRHGCATLLLAQKVPARVVMEILGHSQISMTMDTYSRVVPALLGEAAAAMDSALRPG